jgi:preprotein translocase subunit Sss1
MNDDSVEKVSGFIPEVWFDLSARVVPGAVIVLASSPTDFVWGKSFCRVALGLVIVYVVGFAVDVASEGIFGWVFWPLNKWWPNCFLRYRQLWDDIERLAADQRNVIVKMAAEAVLLRSLFFYCVVQLCLQMTACWCGGTITWTPLSQLKLYPWELSLALAVVAFACWIKMHKAATLRLKAMPQKKK